MLERIEVENIRVFDGPGWNFNFRPLTVLCGTNSSGKSTLLRIPILLRQSQGIGESYGATDGRLRFVGSQVDLGSYESLISNNDASKEMRICVVVSDEMPPSAFGVLTGDEAIYDPTSAPSRRDRADPDNFIPYRLEARLTFGTAPDTAVESTYGWISSQGVLHQATFTVLSGERSLLSWTVSIKADAKGKPSYFTDISVEFISKYKFLSVLDGAEPERVNDGATYRFVTFLDGLLPRSILVPMPEQENAHWEMPLPPVVMQATSALRRTLSSIRYLSPLRSPAKRYYLTQLDTMPPADPAGEFLPYAFREMSKFKTRYYRPGVKDTLDEGELAKAIQEWLGYIRTGASSAATAPADEIHFETQKVLSELRIRSTIGPKKYPLVDSGFGYSQLLPIVIRGLSASTGSTVIIEQPELHLNPALQVRLAEFLVSLVRAEKQVIIETHSEHIVNTIRVLAAEEGSSFLSEKCQVIYFDSEEDSPRTFELSVQDDGTVPDLPPSFFGEATKLAARLLRAQQSWPTPETGDN